MSTIKIEREDTDTKGRYVATIEGVGAALALRVISDAREAGQKITPLCPFFRGYSERHKDEVSDVVTF